VQSSRFAPAVHQGKPWISVIAPPARPTACRKIPQGKRVRGPVFQAQIGPWGFRVFGRGFQDFP
jgi:hypothetical protein